MLLNVKANSIIDTLITLWDDIEACRSGVPRGTFIYEDSPYKKLYDDCHKAEQAFYFASDLLGISLPALYSVTLTVRRWYKKNEWQRCLPESDAARLMECMIKQFPNKSW